MASPSQQFTNYKPTMPQTTAISHDLATQRLKELGPGPYTAEQLKQRDLLLSHLKKESNQTSGFTNITNSANNADATSQAQQSSQTQILDKKALQELVKEVDPTEQLDEDVEDMLLQVADDFIENIINSSCQLAKHRKSNMLEAKDVQFHLERNFNIWIAGFATEELKPYKKSCATEAHKQRLQLIKKSSTTTTKPSDGKDKGKD